MAPIRPAKHSTAARTTFAAKPPADSVFHASKRDKREMKHSLLLSKARQSAGISKSTKRRRPSKKLVTTMEGLEDALPELEKALSKANVKSFGKDGKTETFKSLGSRPGVRRKREKIEREERERFGKNLATLSLAKPADVGVEGVHSATSNRWAALRAHISTSMAEQSTTGGG